MKKASKVRKKKPQGVRVEGLISKKCIRGWLDNWESIQSKDRPPDAFPSNSGPKSYDGVSDTALNKIMLEDAISKLPPVLKVCLYYRWVEQLPLGETLRRTGIPKSTYYRRCDKAIEFIYFKVNGQAGGIKRLIDLIAKGL